MFFINAEQTKVYILIYVDDILITGNNICLFNKFIVALNKEFALKDLGGISYFLGIEVHRDETRIFLNQTNFINDFLDILNLNNIKPCNTPTVTRRDDIQETMEKLWMTTHYQRAIEALQYITHTRPET